MITRASMNADAVKLANQQSDLSDVVGKLREKTKFGDVKPLLEKVDHPVATNPDPRLRALAQERGWRILDLFTAHP